VTDRREKGREEGKKEKREKERGSDVFLCHHFPSLGSCDISQFPYHSFPLASGQSIFFAKQTLPERFIFYF